MESNVSLSPIYLTRSYSGRRRSLPQFKLHQHIEIADHAVEIVEEMEGDTGQSEEKTSLPEEEQI